MRSIYFYSQSITCFSSGMLDGTLDKIGEVCSFVFFCSVFIILTFWPRTILFACSTLSVFIGQLSVCCYVWVAPPVFFRQKWWHNPTQLWSFFLLINTVFLDFTFILSLVNCCCIYRTVICKLLHLCCFSCLFSSEMVVYPNQLWSFFLQIINVFFYFSYLSPSFPFSTTNSAFFSTISQGHWRLLYCMLSPLWELKSLPENLSRWIKWLRQMIGAYWFSFMVVLVLHEDWDI